MRLGNTPTGALFGEMSMFRAWWLVTSKGRFISVGSWVMTYLPFIIGMILLAWILLRKIF
jgi:hypothetical protein